MGLLSATITEKQIYFCGKLMNKIILKVKKKTWGSILSFLSTKIYVTFGFCSCYHCFLQYQPKIEITKIKAMTTSLF